MPEDTPPKADQAAAKPRGSQSSPDNPPEEQRFTVEELRSGARGLLNTSPHAVAGALSGERKKTFTLDEAEAAVKAFLKREVEV